MAQGPNRRRFRRVAPNLPARVAIRGNEAELNGRLLDLGEGGAFFVLDEVVPVSPPMRLSFERVGARCEAVGWVVRVMPHANGQGIAVEFHRANDAFLTFVRELVAADEMARGDLLASASGLVIEIG